jgi:hypothetical protein
MALYNSSMPLCFNKDSTIVGIVSNLPIEFICLSLKIQIDSDPVNEIVIQVASPNVLYGTVLNNGVAAHWTPLTLSSVSVVS